MESSDHMVTGPADLGGSMAAADVAGSSSSPSEFEIRTEEAAPIDEAGEPPKIIDWEDLQQELARLWSLSSALRKAKEKKDALSQQLESIIEVRRQSLHQTNELEEMRQKLEARKFAMANLSLEMKRTSESVNKQEEHLDIAIRFLLVAGKKLVGANQQLREADKMLSGERGHGHLKDLQRMLWTRQQHMITQVSALYPVKTLNEQESRKTPDSHCDGESSESPLPDAVKSSQLSSLTVLGLQLTTIPLKKMSFFSDKKEILRSASVLGYVAHAVKLIASYLNLSLRYPVRLGGSHSYILDSASSSEPASSDVGTNPVFTSMIAKPTEFPLFLEGQDATRAAYAIFLLNKDVEQLLNYIGAESFGPRHVLANLKELMRIILSKDYIDK